MKTHHQRKWRFETFFYFARQAFANRRQRSIADTFRRLIIPDHTKLASLRVIGDLLPISSIEIQGRRGERTIPRPTSIIA